MKGIYFIHVENTRLSKKEKKFNLIELLHEATNQNLYTLNNSHLFLHVKGQYSTNDSVSLQLL